MLFFILIEIKRKKKVNYKNNDLIYYKFLIRDPSYFYNSFTFTFTNLQSFTGSYRTDRSLRGLLIRFLYNKEEGSGNITYKKSS